MVQSESTLFDELVIEKSLRHPTARNFDENAWVEAVKELQAPTERDKRLLIAAIHYGAQIRDLRDTFEKDLFPNFDRRSGILLSLAMANYNHAIVSEKGRKAAKALVASRGFLTLGSAENITVKSAYPGNESTPDTAITAIVDSLPHCLERAICLPLETKTTATSSQNFWQLGARLFSVMSIEHALRDLWQQILWDDWVLRESGNDLQQSPTDRQLAVLWAVWYSRHQKILGQGMTLDAISEKAARLGGQNSEAFLKQTAIGIGGDSKQTRRFRFGKVSGRQFGQSWHRSELTILEDSYLSQFLDAPLPKLSSGLSCRNLQTAWCVVRDCANVLSARIAQRSLDSLDAVEARALLIRRDEIIRAIEVCAEMTAEQAEKTVQFFTCSLDDLGALFTKGFWSMPLALLDDGKNLAICLSALSIGSGVRRVEGWLDRGGLSDHLTDARRGGKYEAWVRNETCAALAANKFLPGAKCAPGSIGNPNNNDEQIDLLILLGGIAVVGEVKCRLYPVESAEHHNYLRRLDDAGDQVCRKVQWLEQNRHVLSDTFQISAERASALRLIPIVVLNQGAGFGLLANGARVVDFHFLRLYLSDREYLAGMAFDTSRRIYLPAHVRLYNDEQDAVARFEETISNPPPLKNAIASAEWRENKFPLSNGRHLIVEVCYSGDPSQEPRRLASILKSESRLKKTKT